MPILPAEPDSYPVELWDLIPGSQEDRRWWCLHTKPRQEKATARHLREQEVPFYSPRVVREGRTPAGRKTRSFLPLFDSYIFMWGDDLQRIEALRGGTLVQALAIFDQTRINRDLRQIRQMLSSGLTISPERVHPVGMRVRIASGPLVGLVGTVFRRGTRDRFFALVDFIGSGAIVDLEDWQVERIDDET